MNLSNLNLTVLQDLNADYGGLKRYAHPKMIPYTKGLTGPSWRKYYLLDLEKSLNKFQEIQDKLKEIDEQGKKILFVATKKNLRGLLSKFIVNSNHFFVDNRWLGGILTNFNTVQKQIFLLQEMYSKENKGTINLLTKKERMMFQKKKIILENNLKGILEMSKLPDYLFIIDPQNQQNAWKEAKKLKIPILAILKTNNNPDVFENFLTINDGSHDVVELIIKEFVKNSLKTKKSALKENITKEEKK